jgi:hypothetical protein
MIVFETTVETLVPEALIAMAVTRQLRERKRNLFRRAVSLARYAAELSWIECWSETRSARRHFEVCWNSLRRGIRGMVVLWCGLNRRSV